MEAVGQFIGNPAFFLSEGAIEVRAVFPLHEFEEFAGLDDERDGQLLGGMELGPVSLGAESQYPLGQVCERGGFLHCRQFYPTIGGVGISEQKWRKVANTMGFGT